VGDQVRLGGLPYVLSSVAGGRLHLSDRLGGHREVPLLVALSDGVEITASETPPKAAAARAGGRAVSDEAWEQARFWEKHVVEVISGALPTASATAECKPQFDPRGTTLAQREAAKAAELSPLLPAGTVSARTVRRKRLRYQSEGLEGLLDRRTGRTEANGARVDPRFLRALYEVAQRQESRPQSAEAWRSAAISEVEQRFPDQQLGIPSRSTIRRIVAKAEASADPTRLEAWGLHPEVLRKYRPGDCVFVDTVDLNVRCVGVEHQAVKLNLTVALDEATGCALAVVVHRLGTVVDGPALVARMCTPRSLLPGHPPGSQRPVAEGFVIRPRRLEMDYGSLSRSVALRDACRTLGVDVAVRNSRTVWNGRQERRVSALTRRLADDMAGMNGWPTVVDDTGLASAQGFVDRWVATVWQASVTGPRGWRPSRDDLWARFFTDRDLYLDLPHSPHTTLSLLPSVLRSVSRTGIRVHGRNYDGPVLRNHQHRSAARVGEDSGGRPAKLRVSYDPTDVSRVWIRPPGGGWAPVHEGTGASGRRRDADRVPDQIPITNTISGGMGFGTVIQASSIGHMFLRQAEAYADTRKEEGQGADGDYDFWGPPGTAGHHDRLAHHAQLMLPNAPLVKAVRTTGRTLALLNAHSLGGRRSLIVTGAPGIGKTTALLSFAQDFEQRDSRRYPDRTEWTPAFYTRVRPGSSARQYLADAVGSLGLPAAGRSTAQLSDLLRDALVRRSTGLVMVDEVDHFESRSSPSALDILRYLTDQVPAVFIFAGQQQPDLEAGNAQTGVRMTHIHGAPVPPGPLWEGLVGDLDNQLLLRAHQPGTLMAMAQDLHVRTGGYVGSLVFLVTRAAVQAIDDGSERIADLLTAQLH